MLWKAFGKWTVSVLIFVKLRTVISLSHGNELDVQDGPCSQAKFCKEQSALSPGEGGLCAFLWPFFTM